MVRRVEFDNGLVNGCTCAFPQQSDPTKNVNLAGLPHTITQTIQPGILQKTHKISMTLRPYSDFKTIPIHLYHQAVKCSI